MGPKSDIIRNRDATPERSDLYGGSYGEYGAEFADSRPMILGIIKALPYLSHRGWTLNLYKISLAPTFR